MTCKLSTGLFLVGLVLLGLAGLDYYNSDDGSGVTVDETEREFPEAAVGEVIHIRCPVRNPTRHTARIIGLPTC